MCNISPRYHRYIARTKSDIQQLSFALLLHNTVNDINEIKEKRKISIYRHAGFGGEATFDMKMTNTLESGTYRVVFEVFPTLFENDTLNYQNNEVLLQSVHGDQIFQIITFSHDWQSDSGGNIPHSKAYIQFNSSESSGTINFQIHYYGSNYVDSWLTIFFFAHTMRGKYDDTFNHDIFDLREGQGYNDQFLFFENINMNDNRIYNLPLPTGPQQPATKVYVDDNALLLSGGIMKGGFSMSGNRIYSLPIPTGSQ